MKLIFAGLVIIFSFFVLAVPNLVAAPLRALPSAIKPALTQGQLAGTKALVGCPKLVAKKLHIVRVETRNLPSGPAYRFILEGVLENKGLAGQASFGFNVTQQQPGHAPQRIAFKLLKQPVRAGQRIQIDHDLHIPIWSEPVQNVTAELPSFALAVLNLFNDQSSCYDPHETKVILAAAAVRRSLPAQLKGGVTSTNLIRGSAPAISDVNVKGVRNKSRVFFNRLPVDKATKAQLATGEQIEYQVLTNAFSGNSARMMRRSWRGQILLPDLRKSGRKKLIHTKNKSRSGTRARKQDVWVIENPDKSLSKQILNSAGQLAGNITFTKDGSVRIGLDLNGDKVADLYELLVSDGEHSILSSPAGQAAWEHFMNGGANPLCTPGASSAGGSFAGGMISGTDKTAMQMVCGRSSGSQSGEGSAGGASRGGGLSGNPGGRTMDAMCKGALSQHRGVPGNPGMAMGDPSDREFSWSRAGHKLLSSFLIAIIPGASLVDDANTLVHADDNPGAAAVTLAGKIPGYGTAATVTNAIGDSLNAGAPRFVNEADRDLKHFEEAQDPGDNTHPDPAVVDRACAAGSSSRFCGAWHREHDSEQSNAGGNAGSGATDPGPDQQTDTDTALYNLCQARARSQAMWDSNTKDTSYVHQLCENPASQPNPAGTSSSARLGGTYGSSITLSSYCGQQGEGATAQAPGTAAQGGGQGRNCGRTESPGTDGQCRGVGNRFNGGSAGSVNITYGAVIGFEPFNPGFDPDPR